MDPEFQRALTVVLIVGLGIGGAGAIALFFIFRAFGGRNAGGPAHFAFIVVLIAFVFLACAGLFVLAYRAQ